MEYTYRVINEDSNILAGSFQNGKLNGPGIIITDDEVRIGSILDFKNKIIYKREA